MAEYFLNPFAFAAGVLLISSPIIIHLINRLRFRRVRWAAMEFLLKAQKRMKRKLILQQLLLLLLRCLIVFLIGLLVGRFLGLGSTGEENRATAHVVILDDSPSMADAFRADDGANTDAFEEAKKVVAEQIARSAAEATTAQTIEVVRLSDLKSPRPFGRLNATTVEELKTYLASYQTTNVRTPLPDGLKKAQEILAAQGGDVNKVVHVVSDFRAPDWNEDGEAIKQVVGELTSQKVKVYFVDVAHPFRKKDDRRSPLAHDNLSVTELSPSKLVVARYDPVEFTLRVRNNGAAEMKNVRFDVKVNGDDNKGRAVEIPSLPGNQERAVKFELTMDRLATDEQPLHRYSLVTAVLATGEPGGLTSDNVRHALVEVREKLPILIVEGRPESRDSKDGDAFYLRPVFTQVLGGFGWVNGTKEDVEKLDLARFSFVLLVNVPSLSDAAIKSLEQYAQTGGGVGFFLGPNVSAKEYNDKLYRDGAGLLPAPLAEKATDPLTDEQLQERRFRISQKKLLLKDPARRNHPAVAGLYTDERGEPVKDAEQLERVFGFISVKQYWPVQRLGKWRDDRSVTELYVMPNEQPISDFFTAIRQVTAQIRPDDPEAAKYKEPLARAKADLRRIAETTEPLYKVAALLDDLLADQQGVGDPNEALLREFWAHPRMADLKREATTLRDRVKFGDPFYLAKEFGRGRVTMVTTTAGEQWTDWPSQYPGNASYTPIIKELGNYLSGAGAGVNRALGQPIEVRLDTNRYKPTARRAYFTHDPARAKPGGVPDPNAAPIVDLKEQALTAEGDKLVLKFTEAASPGAYLFTFTNLKPQGTSPADTAEAPEYRGFAANLDAAREGDLRRASRDDVTVTAPGAQLNSPADTTWLKELQNKKSDLSEGVWLIVLLFVCLIGEQALSTALSYHSAAGDLEGTAPSAAAAMRKSTPGAPAETEAEPTAAV